MVTKKSITLAVCIVLRNLIIIDRYDVTSVVKIKSIQQTVFCSVKHWLKANANRKSYLNTSFVHDVFTERTWQIYRETDGTGREADRQSIILFVRLLRKSGLTFPTPVNFTEVRTLWNRNYWYNDHCWPLKTHRRKEHN